MKKKLVTCFVVEFFSFVSGTFYHELFQFFANHVGKFLTRSFYYDWFKLLEQISVSYNNLNFI